MVPMVRRTVNTQRRLSKGGLLLPLPVTVWFISESATVVAINTHCTVSVVARDRAVGTVNWNLIVIHTQTIALSVAVRKQPALKHLVRRKTDARNNAGRIKCRLFDFGKVVFRVAVEFQYANINKGIVLVRPYLGKVERIIVAF